MAKNKTSDAQIKASRNWEKNNKKRASYIRNRSVARTFVRHWAVEEDIDELLEIYKNENPNAKKEG